MEYTDPFVVFGCLVAIGFLYIALSIGKAVAFPFLHAPWPGFLGGNPFHAIGTAIESAFVAPVNDAIKATESVLSHFFADMVNWLLLIVVAPILIVEGTHKALQYMWSQAFPAKINAAVRPAVDKANEAAAKGTAGTAAASVARSAAEAYARTQDTKTLDAAKAYTRTQVASAKAAANNYADEAVDKLRTAETTAISHANAVATAAQNAAAKASAEATSADAAAAAAKTAAKDAATQAALAAARAVAIPIPQPIPQPAPAPVATPAPITPAEPLPFPSLDDLAGIAGAGALIGAIPVLGLLVNTIATETGLDNEACRGKVKSICRTDPAAWEGLLGGLAAVGFAFSLHDLYDVAQGLVGELAGVIEQAA